VRVSADLGDDRVGPKPDHGVSGLLHEYGLLDNKAQVPRDLDRRASRSHLPNRVAALGVVADARHRCRFCHGGVDRRVDGSLAIALRSAGG